MQKKGLMKRIDKPKNSAVIKICQQMQLLYLKNNVHLWQNNFNYIQNMNFLKEFLEQLITHISYSVTYSETGK